MVNSRQLTGAICLLATGFALADGWTLRDGRFPGTTTVIELSPNQGARLDYIRKCHTDNSLTPYLFLLTRDQSDLLKQQTGVSATRFAAFDSTRGDTKVDLEANVLIRFATNRAEIPHALLISDREALKYEKEVIGWRVNPIEAATPSQIAAGECPG